MTLCVAQIKLELGVCSPGSHQVTVSFLSQPPEYSHIVPHPFRFLSLGSRLSWVKLEDTTSDTGYHVVEGNICGMELSGFDSILGFTESSFPTNL